MARVSGQGRRFGAGPSNPFKGQGTTPSPTMYVPRATTPSRPQCSAGQRCRALHSDRHRRALGPTAHPLSTYLHHRLRLSDSHLQKLYEHLPALSECAEDELWEHNLHVLERAVKGERAEERMTRLVVSNPRLVNAKQLDTWFQFLVSGFGVPNDIFCRVLQDAPDVVDGSIYDAGRSMLFFKGLGWRNRDISQRIVAYYPQLLNLDVDRDVQPVVEVLATLGCYGENLRLIGWEYPRIFARKDYRRQIRKFQYLGLYGLSLAPSASPAESAEAAAPGGTGRKS